MLCNTVPCLLLYTIPQSYYAESDRLLIGSIRSTFIKVKRSFVSSTNYFNALYGVGFLRRRLSRNISLAGVVMICFIVLAAEDTFERLSSGGMMSPSQPLADAAKQVSSSSGPVRSTDDSVPPGMDDVQL